MRWREALGIFRLPNLLMVAVTMYLMRWSVVRPILEIFGLDLQISELAFLGLVLSTVSITAAGYVINDYHDVRADQVNKPERLFLDLHISRRGALFFHWILNLCGVGAGIVFSLLYHVPWMIVVFAGAPLILWQYSVKLKHLFLIGNLAVSFLTATVPLLVLFFEYPLLIRVLNKMNHHSSQGFVAIVFWIGAFAFFAFMTNLIREIVKDTQDIEGDREMCSRTLPIVLGIKKTKVVVIILSFLTILILGVVFLAYLRDPISLFYYGLALFLPFVVFMVLVFRSSKPGDFGFLSQWIKLIMLLGLLYAPLASWLIRHYLVK
jgi:4-hydroxybenzoate polyprenyltransferase